MSRPVVFVTGAGRGVGRAIALRFAREGHPVAVAGRTESFLQEVAAEIEDVRGSALPIVCDVTDRDAVIRATSEATERLGPIDVLVNNAGITRDGMLHKMTPEQWSEVIRVNLDSLFNMTRLVIEGMRERSYGRIVSISSINGQKGQMGQANYSAAKAGLIGFSKAVAQENARKGITVNVVAPGYIDTEMVRAVPEKVLESIIAQIPVGRLGRADEIADAVAYLASERAGFITGSTISVNGGQYIYG